MLSLTSGHSFFLYQGSCDMRKSFDGLCGLVSREPTSGEVFVFLNRSRMELQQFARGFMLGSHFLL